MTSQAPAGGSPSPADPSPAIATEHLRLLTALVLVAARLYPGLAR